MPKHGRDVFRCDCGLETRHPYYIGGVAMCAKCAEEAAPDMVYKTAAKDWSEWSHETMRARSATPDGRRR